MAIIIFTILFLLFQDNFKKIINRKISKNELVIAFSKIVSIISLFVVYFSWNLIKNMSNIMLLLVIVQLIICFNQSYFNYQFIVSLLSILSLSQIEPIKIN